MNRSVKAYLKENKLYIHPILSTNSGGAFTTPVFTENFNAEPEKIGRIVYNTLELYKKGEFPANAKDTEEFLRPLFEASNVTSYASFVTNTKLTFVVINDEFMQFFPTQNNGAKNGFSFLKEKSLKLPLNSNDKEVGLALKEAFALSE